MILKTITKLKIRKLAKDFDLKYKKGIYDYIYLSTEELIISNFFGKSPDPEYTKYGNMKVKDIEKKFQKFYNSKSFQKKLKKMQGGRVTSKKSLNFEKKLVRKIHNKKLKNKVVKIYLKLKKKIGNNPSLVIIEKRLPKNIEKKVLFHEFIHVLNNSNKIRAKHFRWNEGLVTYMEYFGLGKQNQLEQKPKKTSSKMWNIYLKYGYKWALLFKNAQNPKERKEIILKKLKQINK